MEDECERGEWLVAVAGHGRFSWGLGLHLHLHLHLHLIPPVRPVPCHAPPPCRVSSRLWDLTELMPRPPRSAALWSCSKPPSLFSRRGASSSSSPLARGLLGRNIESVEEFMGRARPR